ncbi:hypothetical protein PTE30175_04540 [Pandoraea terrae]|uniref:LRAT domain-containing protein n=1 Tax=Pandoraea terrae TaxID=1537710 RepID=A0A5E4YPJ7_9BURK|nr:lecithin retinol acyltransferase family protein [Pandoraea terrae]VVE50190.1 hypothetical protein PTE30175_04540 [Pandoraea terrae]
MSHQDQRAHDRQACPAAAADDFPLGAHLVTERHGYEHHGIYVGEGKVIHYAGFAHSLHPAPVEESSLERFAAGHGISVKRAPCAKYVGMEAVRRARSRLGENEYRLLTNNCEHFCSWCLFGESRSEQVEACLSHPRIAVHAVINMLKTFLETEWKGRQPGLRIA